MGDFAYQIHESAIYRQVKDEIILIQTETGIFYYFNKETRQLFDYMRNPRTLSDIAQGASLAGKDASEMEYLRTFCHQLVEKKVLQRKQPALAPPTEKLRYGRPILLREGQKKLEDVVSDVVLMTTFEVMG